jgi:hypothetical protein
VKFRGLLVGGAVLASTLAMTSAATIANAATATSHPVASVSSTQGVVEAGVVPPTNAKVGSTPTAQGSCAEPHCNMTYHGGFIESRPRVMLVFWGSKWTRSAYNGARKYLINLYRGLGASRDHWSTTMTQYKGRNGHPSFGGSVLWNWYYSFDKMPRSITPGDLSSLAKSLARQHRVGGTSIQIVIASQSGACFSDGFAGSCGHPHSTGRYCGWHSATNRGALGGISFTNLPYQLDAGGLCGEGWHGDHFAGFSAVGGHEYAEATTDPYPLGGSAFAWIDLHDGSGGEIGDKCAWGNDGAPSGYISLNSGKFVVQSLWSNAAHRCVM